MLEALGHDSVDFEYERTWELLQFERLNRNGSVMNMTGNLTVTYENVPPNIIHHPVVQVTICSLYFFIVIFGIFGNGLVVYVVTRNKAMHTVTNFFIASLAINDIIICALTVPLTPLYTFLEGWYFGSFMCHLFPLIQAASVYISTLTLTAIAVERFCVICFPYLPKLTTKSACLIIASIWFLSLSICTPYAIFMKYTYPSKDNLPGPGCDEDWPSVARRIFGTVSLVVQYSIPLLVITCSYVCIWVKLRAQASKGLSSSQRGREPSAILRKRRTNRMLVAMVIIFGCCWLPLNLVNILNDYFPTAITKWAYFVLVFFLSHIVAVSSTCYNPLLYAWMNENFRKEFKTVLPCFSDSQRADSLRTRSFYQKGDGSPSGTTNGHTSMYITGDTDSTYIKSVSPQMSSRKNTNGSTKTNADSENGRLIKGRLLAVPNYVTVKVQDNPNHVPDPDEDADDVYDV